MPDTTNDVLRIRKLALKNFRCFEDKTIEFSDHFNVLIGDNGSGKTAVLDGLALMCSPLPAGVGGEGDPNPVFSEDDVRLRAFEAGNVEKQLPAQLAWDAMLARAACDWQLGVSAAGKPESNPGRLQNAALHLREEVAEGRALLLPLLVHYLAERQWPAPASPAKDAYVPGPRATGYTHWLSPAVSVPSFLSWFEAVDRDSYTYKREHVGLSAVKGAVRQCVPDCQDVVYDPLQRQPILLRHREPPLPFDRLSHGVKGMLAMVADIAWRAHTLNPHLGEGAPEQTPGVVLIDEIDLHLHPKWQRTVVDDLRRTFPKVQFIATTHSPFIIQSLEPGELISLDAKEGEEHTDPEQYVDRSIEEVAEAVQGVEDGPMSARRAGMWKTAEEYYRLLQEAKGASPEQKERLKRRLDELVAPYSGNVAYHAFLRMERLAAGLGGEAE